MEVSSPEAPEFGTRVLLVEDDPEHAFVAVALLRQLLGEGSEVIITESTNEAVGLIGGFTEQDRPDLIMVDLRSPEQNGFDVMTAVRDHEPSSQVPMLVLTNSRYDRDVAFSYQLGASAVLSKPLSRAELREELKRIGTLR